MSIIGPRPHQPREVALYEQYQERLLTVKPGITGMAQVNGRDELSIEHKVLFETEYLNKQSFWFDIKILWMTFLKVVKRDGVSH